MFIILKCNVYRIFKLSKVSQHQDTVNLNNTAMRSCMHKEALFYVQVS